MGDNAIIPRSFYAATQSDYIDKYGYKMDVTYTDAETGESVTSHWFVKSDKPLSKHDIDNVLMDQLSSGSQGERGTVESWNFTTLYHRSGSGW